MLDESINRFKRATGRKSLRTVLIFWFLVFTIIPLVFMTLFSIFKLESIADQELRARLESNFREVSSRFQVIQLQLKKNHIENLKDNNLQYNIVNEEKEEFEKLLLSWLRNGGLTEVSIFDSDGKALASVVNRLITRVETEQELSSFFLPEDFLSYMSDKESIYIIDLRENNSLEFVAFSKILTPQNILLGYLKETIVHSSDRIKDLSDKLSAEILFNKRGSDIIVTSLKKSFTKLHKNSVYLPGTKDKKEDFLELSLDGQPYTFMSKQLLWDDDSIILSIGVSKRSLLQVLENINYAFLGMLFIIIILLILLSLIISRIILKPLSELVSVVNKDDPASHLINLPVSSDDEIGQLKRSFNKMFSRVYNSQNRLKENIFDLEQANADILDAQTQVVQTAKMASLGQLVSGVAHELNNPIGFIHSNMGHLKEYSEVLIKIIESIPLDSAKDLEKLKKELDYEYIVKDLPKLIQSCEDGSKRTRDIVLGLRSFSRLEEAQRQEVSIHEGLESTIRLLHSEFQSRIEIIKNYGDIPKVFCYPSQLNQVFMNILSNSAQSILDKGQIIIVTELSKNKENINIIISDNGEGMSESVQGKIFDPFYTTKPTGVGTGLGLSISYGIIKKHEGVISVKSEEGQGTSFTISIPLKIDK